MTGDEDVRVHVLGGTVVGGEWVGGVLYDESRHGLRDDADIKILPVAGKAEAMMEDVDPEVWRRIARLRVTEAKKLLDSADYDPANLMRIVREVRAILTEDPSHLVLPVGTDSAAFLMHALAEGIPAELLGDDRSLIVVASQHHASPNRPQGHEGRFYPENDEAVSNLGDATYLATRKEMRGKMGLCCGGILHAPRGLHKINTDGLHPFLAKYQDIAVSIGNSPLDQRWQFDLEDRNERLPRKRTDDYLLSLGGVETWTLTPTSNYENLAKAMWGLTHPAAFRRWWASWWARKKADEFCGMVVQAPGVSNLRHSKRNLEKVNVAAQIGAEAGAPLVIISDPLQTEDGAGRKRAVYGGSLAAVRGRLDRIADGSSSLIVDGGDLSRTEATMLMSEAVARARSKKCSGKEVVTYVAGFFERYRHWLETGEEEPSSGTGT